MNTFFMGTMECKNIQMTLRRVTEEKTSSWFWKEDNIYNVYDVQGDDCIVISHWS